MQTEVQFDGKAVADQLRGESEADSFLQALRTKLGSGDELFELIRRLTAGDDLTALRGCCRCLQKALSRR